MTGHSLTSFDLDTCAGGRGWALSSSNDPSRVWHPSLEPSSSLFGSVFPRMSLPVVFLEKFEVREGQVTGLAVEERLALVMLVHVTLEAGPMSKGEGADAAEEEMVL